MFKVHPYNTLSRAELSFEKGIVKNLHYGDILIKFNEILDSCDKKIPFISRDMNFEKIKNAILKNGDVVIADAAEDEAVGKCTEIFNISQNEQIISGLHTIPCRPNIDCPPQGGVKPPPLGGGFSVSFVVCGHEQLS